MIASLFKWLYSELYLEKDNKSWLLGSTSICLFDFQIKADSYKVCRVASKKKNQSKPGFSSSDLVPFQLCIITSNDEDAAGGHLPIPLVHEPEGTLVHSPGVLTLQC